MSAVQLQKIERGCPVCGAIPTATQYVFYPKFSKLKCRGCRTELKYVFPLWKKVVSSVLSGIVTIVGLAAIMALEVTHGLPFAWWALAYIAVLFILASYVEAAHVQRRYSPSTS
jgi:hypothetical protein